VDIGLSDRELDVCSVFLRIIEIEGEKYLLGVRHSGGVWALFPCSINESEHKIYFKRSKYILRRLHEIKIFVETFEGYKIVPHTNSK
jgi:hypothetical protein